MQINNIKCDVFKSSAVTSGIFVNVQCCAFSMHKIIGVNYLLLSSLKLVKISELINNV